MALPFREVVGVTRLSPRNGDRYHGNRHGDHAVLLANRFAARLLAIADRAAFDAAVDELVREMDGLSFAEHDRAVNVLWNGLGQRASTLELPVNSDRPTALFFCTSRTTDLDIRVKEEVITQVEPVKCFVGGKACNAFRMYRNIGGEAVLLTYPDLAFDARKVVLLDHAKKRVLYADPLPSTDSDPWDVLNTVSACLNRMPRGSLIVIGGSFHPALAAEHLDYFFDSARSDEFGLVVDCSAKLTEVQVIKILEAKPLVLQSNEAEFRMLCRYVNIDGMRERQSLNHFPDISQVVRIAQELIKSFGLSAIAVTLRQRGAVLCTRNEIHYGHSRWPIASVAGGLGSGDSFCGAMAYALSQEPAVNREINWRRVLNFSLAAATAKVKLLGTQMPSRDLVLQEEVIMCSQ